MKKKDDKSFTIMLALIACILTVINIKLYISKYEKLNDTTNEIQNTVSKPVKKTDEEKRQALIAELKKLKERDRMERYFGEYIGYVEAGEYQKAYDLLYPDFKQNYFPTLEKFTAYVNEKYPDIIIVDYENIERQGNYYVLFVKIPSGGRESKLINQTIILEEKDYAEYYLSFSL